MRRFRSFTGSWLGFTAALLSCFVAGLSPAANAQTRIQARPADQFVDSMGINVHMEALKTPYRNYDKINEALASLGMRHFRDEINDTTSSFVHELRTIGSLGYTLCGLIEGGNDYPPLGTKLTADHVVPIILNLLPTIDAVEGPNEPDNTTFVYDGLPYPYGAINEAEDLWNIVKNDSAVSFLPVIALSEGNAPDFVHLAALTPPPVDYATYGNLHAYQGGLLGNYALADYYIPFARDLNGGKPLWTTEMGYHNNRRYLSNGEQQGVSKRASAIYLPIAFLAGFNRGVMRTFSYELIDEYNPKAKKFSGEGHYGLLNFDGTPKPAYAALQNLIALLGEPGVQPFAPGSLVVSFTGAPSTIAYTLLEKSNGDYYLALWNDISVYQVATASKAGKDLDPQNVPVRLTFEAAEDFTVYAPNDASGAHPTDAYTISTRRNSIAINLPPQVLVIKIAAHRKSE